MSSQKVRDHFDAYVDDELSAEQIEAFNAVLDQDSELKSEFDNYNNVVKLINALPRHEPPDHLYQNIRRRIRKRVRTRHTVDYMVSSVVFEAAICAVLICILAGLYMYTWAGVTGPQANQKSGQVDYVHVEAVDRQTLSQLGQIVVVGTEENGAGLDIQIRIRKQHVERVKKELSNSSRLALIREYATPNSSTHWTLHVRAPAGPVGPSSVRVHTRSISVKPATSQ